MLQAEVQAREVLQAASLLRHRLQHHSGRLLCAAGLQRSGDVLRSAADLLHRFGLLCDSCSDLLLGSRSDLLHPGCNLLCSGAVMLHGPSELLCCSLGVTSAR